MSFYKQRMVKIKFRGSDLADLDFWSKSDPFLVLSRPCRNGYGLHQVRKTETIWNDLNPDWKILYIPTKELCDDNFDMRLQLDVYDEDVSSRNDLIGSTMLSLGDMFSLATSSSSVELYKKGKYRGKLFITQCQVELPVDMVGKDGKQGSVSRYPPKKQLNVSASLPAYWKAPDPSKSYLLANPTYPHQPPSNIILRSSKIPPNYQGAYQPLSAAGHALASSNYHARSASNPEGMVRRNQSSSVLKKLNQGASIKD
eukprot:GFUD01099539.1.p1 GENE.GFUD01099539.1~~GFUD01099539.1.p1  ORF type:complete len:264 (+),score=64.47 GFUD01099539.1:27-794(+)